MSRRLSATEERVRELEAELKKWRDAYRELALAIARRDGYGPEINRARQAEKVTPIPAAPALPPSVLAAIEDTTAPFSEARTVAIEASRALLESGAQPEAVEAHVRGGEEIIV